MNRTLSKRIQAFVIMMVMMVSVFTVNNIEAKAAIQNSNLPTVSLNGKKDFSINSDTDTTVTITARNMGSEPIRDLSISFESSPSISISSNSMGETFNLNGSSEVSITVRIRASAGAGSQEIQVSFAYFHETRDEYKITTDILTVDVTDLPKETGSSTTPTEVRKPKLVQTEPVSYVSGTAGITSSVGLALKNAGNYSAQNITVTAVPSDKFRISFVDNSNSIKTIGVGASNRISLTFTPDASLEAGVYPIEFNVIYYSLNNEELSTKATVNVKIKEAEAETPTLTLNDFVISSNKIAGGDKFKLTATLQNTSKFDAKNVQVILSGLSNEGISRSNSASNSNFSTLSAGAQKTITFDLQAADKIETGSYEMKLKLVYSDNTDKQHTTELSYYIAADSKEKAEDDRLASLEITQITAPSGTFGVGQDFSISVTVKNSGEADAKNVKVSAGPDSAIVPKSSNVQNINILKPGESKTLNYTFAATQAAKSQYYTIGFTVDYNTGAEKDGEESISQYSGVLISNPEGDEEEGKEKTKSTPKIIVSSYKADPIIVQAGKEFDLFIDFKNTHSTKTIYNIKANLTVVESTQTSGNVFTPVDASNTFYVSEIAPNSVSEQYVRMYTVPDAAAKNHIIIVNFEYEDEDGTAITAREEIGVNVKQVTQLDIGDIWMQESAGVGEKVYVSFNVHNTGKVTLNNLKIKVIGENIEAPDSEIIYGNFVSGTHDYYDASFYGSAPGPGKVNIVISYDDSTGEHIERVEEYKIEFYEVNYGDMGMNAEFPREGMEGMYPGEMPAEGGFIGWFGWSWWIWIGTGAGIVVLAAIIVTVVIIKKKKARDIYE